MYQVDKLILHNFIRLINPHIIHAHGTEDIYAYSAVTSPVPCVISTQGMITSCYKMLDKKISIRGFIWLSRAIIEIITIKRGLFFIVKTDFDCAFVKNINPHAHVFRIPEPINDVFLKTCRSNKISKELLYVGTITKLKGIEDLLNAFIIVKKYEPEMTLKIIGTGETSYVNFLYRKYKMFNNDIVFCGYQPSEVIAKAMSTAMLLVHPSHIDNNPNVLWEASSVGIPIVATNVGGIPSIIKRGIPGHIVPSKSPALLASKILFLIKNYSNAREIAEKAKPYIVKALDANLIANKVISVYEMVIKAGRRCL